MHTFQVGASRVSLFRASLVASFFAATSSLYGRAYFSTSFKIVSRNRYGFSLLL